MAYRTKRRLKIPSADGQTLKTKRCVSSADSKSDADWKRVKLLDEQTICNLITSGATLKVHGRSGYRNASDDDDDHERNFKSTKSKYTLGKNKLAQDNSLFLHAKFQVITNLTSCLF